MLTEPDGVSILSLRVQGDGLKAVTYRKRSGESRTLRLLRRTHLDQRPDDPASRSYPVELA